MSSLEVFEQERNTWRIWGFGLTLKCIEGLNEIVKSVNSILRRKALMDRTFDPHLYKAYRNILLNEFSFLRATNIGLNKAKLLYKHRYY
jgi:hypothetical protein